MPCRGRLCGLVLNLSKKPIEDVFRFYTRREIAPFSMASRESARQSTPRWERPTTSPCSSSSDPVVPQPAGEEALSTAATLLTVPGVDSMEVENEDTNICAAGEMNESIDRKNAENGRKVVDILLDGVLPPPTPPTCPAHAQHVLMHTNPALLPEVQVCLLICSSSSVRGPRPSPTATQ